MAAKSCVIGHASPLPKTPWWEWACASCSPELYEAMTLPGEPTESKVSCPLCLNKVSYSKGLLRAHGVDTIQRCPASGTSLETAEAVLSAVLFRRTVDQMLDSVTIKRVPGQQPTTDKPLSPEVFKLQVELSRIRKARTDTLPASELSAILGMHKSIMSAWETGTAAASLEQAIRWSAALEHRLVLRSKEDEYPVYTTAEIMTLLRNCRIAANITLKQISTQVGYSHNGHAGEYERGKKVNLSMERFSKWANALGMSVGIEEIKPETYDF